MTTAHPISASQEEVTRLEALHQRCERKLRKSIEDNGWWLVKLARDLRSNLTLQGR